MALDAYHRELAKLNPQMPGTNLPGLLALQQQALSQQHLTGHHNGMAQDLSLPKDRKEPKLPNGELDSVPNRRAFPLARPKLEPGVCPLVAHKTCLIIPSAIYTGYLCNILYFWLEH